VNKKENPCDNKKKALVYNYIKKSVDSLDYGTSENASTLMDKYHATDSKKSYFRDTASSKSRKQLGKKPKISKPTKTITMTI
jgi:hypothetical protein